MFDEKISISKSIVLLNLSLIQSFDFYQVKSIITRASLLGLALLGSSWAFGQCPLPFNCTPGNATNPQANLFGGGIFQVQIGSFSHTSAGAAEGYRDNCNLGDIPLTVGMPSAVNIRTGNNFSENLRVYIDVNNDGVFTAPGELFFSSNNAKTHTGSILINAGSVGSRVKIRITSDLITAANLPGPCTTPEYSQVEDYVALIQENVTPPMARFVASDSVTCTGTVVFTDQSLNNPNTWFWNFGDGQTSTLQNPTHTYATSGFYTVKLKVGNVFGFDSLTKTNYISYNDTVPPAASCQPITFNQCCGYGISRVSIGSIDNNSSLGSYQNFTCTHRTTLFQGKPYAISIGTNPNQDQDTRVWIDYNNNGIFEPNELVYSALATRNPQGSVFIGADPTIVLNTPLRMRVMSEFSGATFDPCTDLDKGQTEDYTVIIKENNEPPVASFRVSSSNFCQPTFNFTSTSQNSISQYIWYFGDGNSDTTTIGSASHTYASTGTYRVSLKVNGPFGSDSISVANAVNYFGAPLISCVLNTQQGGPQFGTGIAEVSFGSIFKRSGNSQQGYQNYSCTDQTSVKIGQTIPLTVRNSGTQVEKVQVWIDWNGNGTFETSERVMFSQSDTVHTVNVIVPGTAVSDRVVAMRVASNFQNAGQFNACGNIQVGQAEDYGIVILSNNQKPVAKFAVASTSSCTGIVQFVDQSENIPTSYQWTFGDGQTSTQSSPTHTYTNTGTYSITLITTNAFGSDTLIRPNYITVTQLTGMNAASCTPVNSNTCCQYGIQRVTFAGINKVSQPASEGNKDFTCETIGTATIGTQMPITIINSGTNPENVAVWIDWNNDGNFAANELVFSSNASTSHGGNITIPGNAPAGIGLRVRVRSDLSNQPIGGACDVLQFGQTEDYQIILQGNNQAPVALFTANNTVSCQNTIAFRDTSFNAPTQWKWYFGDGDSSTLRNPSHTYSQPGIYTVTLITTNANGADTLRKIDYITILENGFIKNAPCTPQTQNTGTNNPGVGIRRVMFNTIVRTSNPAPAENYVDASCTFRTEVSQGQTYPVSVITGNQFNEICRIWIDWNNDGVFSDPAERVFNSTALANHSGNITIPLNAVTDTVLRMRVMSDAAQGGGPGGVNLQPCMNPNFGQCEDYGVKVIQNTLPPVANFQSASAQSCNGYIQFFDNSENNPTQWLWEFGDGQTSTQQNPLHQYPFAGIFNVKLKVWNNYGVDSLFVPGFAIINGLEGPRPPSCYPTTSNPGPQNGTTRVRFGTLDKTSGFAAADGGYLDYTCTDSALVVVTAAGQSNSLIVNASGGQVRETVRVYIDFNNNGTFEQTESVMNSTAMGLIHNAAVILTEDRCLGIPVRMRVITDNRNNPITNACFNPTAGQVEDYTVKLVWAVSATPQLSSAAPTLIPNPANQVAKIQLSDDQNLKGYQIMDLQGKTILAAEGSQLSAEIALSELPNGVYTVRIVTPTSVSTQRLIVQH